MNKLLFLVTTSILIGEIFSFNLRAEENQQQEPYTKHNFSVSTYSRLSSIKPSFTITDNNNIIISESLKQSIKTNNPKKNLLFSGLSLGYNYNVTDRIRVGLEAVIAANSSNLVATLPNSEDTYGIKYKSSSTFLFNAEYDLLKKEKHSFFLLTGVGVAMHSVAVNYNKHTPTVPAAEAKAATPEIIAQTVKFLVANLNDHTKHTEYCRFVANNHWDSILDNYKQSSKQRHMPEVLGYTIADEYSINCVASIGKDVPAKAAVPATPEIPARYENITKTMLVTTIPYQIGFGYSYNFTRNIGVTTKVYYAGNNTFKINKSFDDNKLDAKFNNLNSLNLSVGLAFKF